MNELASSIGASAITFENVVDAVGDTDISTTNASKLRAILGGVVVFQQFKNTSTPSARNVSMHNSPRPCQCQRPRPSCCKCGERLCKLRRPKCGSDLMQLSRRAIC